MMKTPVFGDLEPAHILARAAELRTNKAMSANGEHPWISTAPAFEGDRDYQNPSPEFRKFLMRERGKLYRGISKDGEITLNQNPAARDWKFLSDGRICFFRALPIPTGERVQKPKGFGGSNRFAA